MELGRRKKISENKGRKKDFVPCSVLTWTCDLCVVGIWKLHVASNVISSYLLKSINLALHNLQVSVWSVAWKERGNFASIIRTIEMQFPGYYVLLPAKRIFPLDIPAAFAAWMYKCIVRVCKVFNIYIIMYSFSDVHKSCITNLFCGSSSFSAVVSISLRADPVNSI